MTRDERVEKLLQNQQLLHRVAEESLQQFDYFLWRMEAIFMSRPSSDGNRSLMEHMFQRLVVLYMKHMEERFEVLVEMLAQEDDHG